MPWMFIPSAISRTAPRAGTLMIIRTLSFWYFSQVISHCSLIVWPIIIMSSVISRLLKLMNSMRASWSSVRNSTTILEFTSILLSFKWSILFWADSFPRQTLNSNDDFTFSSLNSPNYTPTLQDFIFLILFIFLYSNTIWSDQDLSIASRTLLI